MKASDLRIGNYILSINDEILTVSEIRETKIIAKGIDGKNRYYLFEHIKPIPLTEEILLKCGFDKHIETGWFVNERNKIVIDLFWHYLYIDGSLVSKNSERFKHLHQLQNLYYALTNQELEIKL